MVLKALPLKVVQITPPHTEHVDRIQAAVRLEELEPVLDKVLQVSVTLPKVADEIWVLVVDPGFQLQRRFPALVHIGHQDPAAALVRLKLSHRDRHLLDNVRNVVGRMVGLGSVGQGSAPGAR